MTPEMERIGKVLVEAEGGHWHDDAKVLGGIFICSQCDGLKSRIDNPNFSKWKNFGRLLKISKQINHSVSIHFNYYLPAWIITFVNHRTDENIRTSDENQIPALVATELAKILEGK